MSKALLILLWIATSFLIPRWRHISRTCASTESYASTAVRRHGNLPHEARMASLQSDPLSMA